MVMLTQGKLDNHVGGLGLLRSVQLPFVAKAEKVIASFINQTLKYLCFNSHIMVVDPKLVCVGYLIDL